MSKHCHLDQRLVASSTQPEMSGFPGSREARLRLRRLTEVFGSLCRATQSYSGAILPVSDCVYEISQIMDLSLVTFLIYADFQVPVQCAVKATAQKIYALPGWHNICCILHMASTRHTLICLCFLVRRPYLNYLAPTLLEISKQASRDFESTQCTY